MIVQNLKNTTAPFHNLSEELNFSSLIMDGSITKSQYLLLLQRLYALFNQVAVLQKNNVPESILPASFFETKAAIVKEDIRQLTDNYNAMAPVFTSVSYYEYLGFCYVALGSMLGGQGRRA